ncbi:MAG: acyltransferase [Aliivibrio sp.]|uniref:acyltransferase family protein n=1 Tax=Aliivibrio sp. TaxID=1872443 RepID=UPI001A5BF983|nr:acyltransferase [Aliivibrio sp.]
MIKFSKYNNIEWLRLVFALQVVFVHAFEHLNGTAIPFLSYFPGVPAFFFTSGFLIYASYERSPSLKNYFLNRFLRLFPALFIVSLAAFFLAAVAKGTEHFLDNLMHYLTWFIGQITILQVYNPAMFRDIGLGVMNGSLWTITVEILFYLSIPIIIFLESFFKWTVPVLFFLSFSLYSLGERYLGIEFALGKTIFEFLELTPLVWGWMFLLGTLSYKFFDRLVPLLNKFWLAFVGLICLGYLNQQNVFLAPSSNHLGIIYFLLYGMAILYIAFVTRYVPLKFDLSYGIYIWHGIVINFLLIFGSADVTIALVLTIMLAVFSWFVVEKPSLKLKNYSLLNRS